MAVLSGKTTPWLTCSQPHPGARIRLICFPWCGGGSQIYARWGGDFDADIEGREIRSKEDCITDLRKTTKLLAEAIYKQYSDKPYAFLGHSMGCVLCYEVAVYLKERYGKQPIHIFFSSEYAPHSTGRKQRLEAEFHSIAQWSDEDLTKRIASHGGTPKDLLENKDYMKQNVLPTYRSDLNLCATYFRPLGRKKLLTCNVSAVQPDRDEVYNMKEYGDLTSGSLEVTTISGGHFYLFDDDGARSLREFITTTLNKQ